MATLPPIPNPSRQTRRTRPGLSDAGGGASAPGSAGGSPISRIPPHSFEAEESLLGAMLLSRDAVAVAVEEVSAEDFYKPSHAHIFSAITTLYGRGRAGRRRHRRRGDAPPRQSGGVGRRLGPHLAASEHAGNLECQPVCPHRPGARSAATPHRRRL